MHPFTLSVAETLAALTRDITDPYWLALLQALDALLAAAPDDRPRLRDDVATIAGDWADRAARVALAGERRFLRARDAEWFAAGRSHPAYAGRWGLPDEEDAERPEPPGAAWLVSPTLCLEGPVWGPSGHCSARKVKDHRGR